MGNLLKGSRARPSRKGTDHVRATFPNSRNSRLSRNREAIEDGAQFLYVAVVVMVICSVMAIAAADWRTTMRVDQGWSPTYMGIV